MGELILLAAIPFTVAALFGYWLPRFSRGFLGPAVIILTLIACYFWMKEFERGPSDAWGPGGGILVLIVGAVGVVTGLVLVFVGAVRASRTPERLFVVATIVFPVLLFLALVFSL